MKKALIAFDCSAPSQKALDYAAGLLPLVPGAEAVLVSVAAGVPYDDAELAEPARSHEVHGDEDFSEELARIQAALSDAEALLRAKGMAGERIETVIKPLRLGVAQDIVDQARTSACDTIVVGRQYHSRVKELLSGSVSNDLVHQASGLTVWVVE